MTETGDKCDSFVNLIKKGSWDKKQRAMTRDDIVQQNIEKQKNRE